MPEPAPSLFGVYGPGTVLGYCTNVHPGVRITDVQRQLIEHACAVRDRVSPVQPLPIGLWLSRKAASELIGDPGLFESFRECLSENGLLPFTFNAFPYGDFHGPQVKRRVYRPDWAEYERLEYTLAIAAIAADLVPRTAALPREVSISTLPLGWRGLSSQHETIDVHAAAQSFRSLARHLARVESDTGCCIHIDVEPEPGCHLDAAEGVVRFFSEHLLRNTRDIDMILRHIRVCHDVCHSAVMFESQTHALATYAAAGVRVGKVQISAALQADFESGPDRSSNEVVCALEAFAENRYLHQTCMRDEAGAIQRFDDLPEALQAVTPGSHRPRGLCRVHFHTPIFSHQLGLLSTTADQIGEAVECARRLHDTKHFEIETYAWGVLPPEHRPRQLADGIADEFRAAVNFPGNAS